MATRDGEDQRVCVLEQEAVGGTLTGTGKLCAPAHEGGMRIPPPCEEIEAQKAEGHEKCGRLAPQRRQQRPH